MGIKINEDVEDGKVAEENLLEEDLRIEDFAKKMLLFRLRVWFAIFVVVVAIIGVVAISLL